MKKHFFFACMWLLLGLTTHAQTSVTVGGTVTQLADGAPVANHLVFCFINDSLDPSGGLNTFAEAFTDANGQYQATLTLPNGVDEIFVATVTYCQPEFFQTVIAPVVNGEVNVDFQLCEDTQPPLPDCWAGIGVIPQNNQTFDFQGYYYNLDSTVQGLSYQWSFGDGTASNDQNPTHTYAQPGFYIVSLTVIGSDSCIATAEFFIDTSFHGFPECMGYILYSQTGTTSFDFSAELYDANGMPVQALSYLWDFGDGNTSTEATPSHTYSDEGVYTVQLHALTADSCDIHACDVVFAMDCWVDTFWYGCQAMFATGLPWPDTANWSPLTVSFIDMSLGAVAEWSWSFGDGTSSNEQNPTHTYATAGIYTVTLSITTLDGCESSATFEICVGDANCWLTEHDCQALFIPLPDSLGSNGIQFIDLSFAPGPITSWTWSFGDGTASSEQNPYHVYSQPGVYPVTLTIEADSCNSAITFEVDTESPWNFNNSQDPAKLGQSSLSTAVKNPDVLPERLQVFPNPATDMFSVAFDSKQAAEYLVTVRDASGKVVSEQIYQSGAGAQVLRMNSQSWAPGLYLVALRSGQTVQTVKMVKQ